ncbi:MAG: hypothetical protein JNN12_00210 [Bacteroidetes Order II. Incertae sedis bacterium]|nr:hypothetical protein [Bacteroidetes Order II. bacterium]
MFYSPSPILKNLFPLVLVAIGSAMGVHAQMFSIPSREKTETSERGLSVGRLKGTYQIRADLASGGTQTLRFDPMQLYYAVLQTPGLVVSGVLGSVNACDTGASCVYEIRDFHAASINGIPLNRQGRNQFSVPIGLVLDFRRSGPKDQFNAPGAYFGVTAAQLATGVAGDLRVGRKTALVFRAMAGGGLALQTQDSGLGLARQYDATAELRLSGLIGRYGLVIGADLRGFDWDVRYTGLQFKSSPQQTRYAGKQMGARVGILF